MPGNREALQPGPRRHDRGGLQDFGLKRNEGTLEEELLRFGRDMRSFGEARAAKDAEYFELFSGTRYPLGSFYVGDLLQARAPVPRPHDRGGSRAGGGPEL